MVAMSYSRRWLLFLYLTLLVIPHQVVFAQFSFQIAIHSPQAGEAVQGVVPVIGFASVDGFSSYQLDFAVEGEENPSWFQIVSNTTAVEDDLLGDWDTTALTDGNYQIRLTVYRQAGDPVEVITGELRVRNYSPIETNTPSPVDTAAPQETETATMLAPTSMPSPFPPNPAEISTQSLQNSAVVGICLGLLLLTLVGVLSINLPERQRKRRR